MFAHRHTRFFSIYEAPSEFGRGLQVPTIVPISDDSEGFDYGALPDDVANEARAAADQIRTQTKAASTAFIEIGRTLLRMRERIEHGSFLPWARHELGMQPRTVQRFMRAAEFLEAHRESVSLTRLTRDALYALTQPSVPDKVRDAVVADLERGDATTPTEIRRRIAAATAKPRAHEPIVQTGRKRAPEAVPMSTEAQEDEPQYEVAPVFARLSEEMSCRTRHEVLNVLDRIDPGTFARHLRAAIESLAGEQPLEMASGKRPAPDIEDEIVPV